MIKAGDSIKSANVVEVPIVLDQTQPQVQEPKIKISTDWGGISRDGRQISLLSEHNRSTIRWAPNTSYNFGWLQDLPEFYIYKPMYMMNLFL